MDARACVIAAILQLDRADCVLGYSIDCGLVSVEFVGGAVVEGTLDVTGTVTWED